ncbi:MAG TPA: hypothetical protein VG077_04985 [Verrucomicrobiae bacterium]|nr:hypothetical protein [Verrucomicrobiae bacterium]
MNANALNIPKTKLPSKREARAARASALIFLVVAILSLVFCIKWYVQSDWLKPGAAINLDIVSAMRGMIRVATFVIIPALSILLILSSRLIWKLSNCLGGDKRSNVS